MGGARKTAGTTTTTMTTMISRIWSKGKISRVRSSERLVWVVEVVGEWKLAVVPLPGKKSKMERNGKIEERGRKGKKGEESKKYMRNGMLHICSKADSAFPSPGSSSSSLNPGRGLSMYVPT